MHRQPSIDHALLFDAAPQPLLHVGADGRHVMINAAARELLGESGEAPGRWETLWRRPEVARALLGTVPIEQGLELATAQPCRVKVRSRPLPGGAGWVLDLTVQQPPQQQAEDLMRRLDLVTHTAGIGCWVHERGSARTTWSDALRAIFDLSADERVLPIGEWLDGYVHADDRALVRQGYADWMAQGRDSLALDFRGLRADGTVRHLSTHTRIERGGRTEMLFGVVIDLTERLFAELALRGAEGQVALATHGAGLGTWHLDLDSGTVVWDEQMWVLRGRVPQSRPMSLEERLACMHPDDRGWFQSQLRKATEAGEPFEAEFRVVWPEGQVRWLSTRSVEIRESTTGSRRRIGVNWDITDKRLAEAARHAREMALRESQAKSKFLARMSHELRTPLNAVLGFSQLLLAEAGGGGDAGDNARRRRVEHIHTAGKHLLDLINDVLDLSSLEGGEMRIGLQPVGLRELVDQTLPLLGTLLEHHRVHLELGPLDGTVMADPIRLRQVLLNLLSNAIKYNRAGGLVSLEALPRGDQVLLRVSDTGFGMDDEQLQHLFEPFNRLGRRAEGPDGVEGTGIGLAIVKALVERMGGSVHVHSTPAKGSVFEVRLADAGRAGADAPPGPDGAAPAGLESPLQPAPGVLLYIEDNPVNALIVSELVSRRPDLQLHLAADGASGVQSALMLRPTLVLLDMQLPDFDGHEVLRRMRQHAQLDRTTVIALSANAMPADVERALAAGMSGYLTKPLDFGQFTATLDSLFGPAPARRELQP